VTGPFYCPSSETLTNAKCQNLGCFYVKKDFGVQDSVRLAIGGFSSEERIHLTRTLFIDEGRFHVIELHSRTDKNITIILL
jgi:hypothetical protein